MKRIHNSKRGFTLVEMMLALAIITIIGWTTVALMIATKDSFMTTYNTNDSASYALMYANGFENSFLEHTQNGKPGKFGTTQGDGTGTNDSVLEQADGVPVFKPRQLKTTNVNSKKTVDKWLIRMYFHTDATDASQTVKYKIIVVDNYYSPTPKVMCTMDGSVWPPHLTPGKMSFSNYASPDTLDGDLRSAYSLDSSWYNYVSLKA